MTPTAGAAISATSQANAPTSAAVAAATPAPFENEPIAGGPVLERADISLRKVAELGPANVKLALNPKDGMLYYLSPGNGVWRVDFDGNTTPIDVGPEINPDGIFAGMAFGPDGILYVVLNRNVTDTTTQAVIRRGIPNGSGKFNWDMLAQTEPYAFSATNFDHLYNGIVVSPDNQYVFVNAGSRTDHGEVEDNHGAFPNLREIPLTSAIFRIPTNAHNLTLPAVENALKPYLYADGTRNSYDPEFAPNGDLFAGDNGPDADYPDELNWIRQGFHYGFPWRFGNQDNPVRNPNYDALDDRHLHYEFQAVQLGTYKGDPTFPAPPPGVTFTDPIPNHGPSSTVYRGDDGNEHNAASEGKLQYTFTPHIAPLGLVFVTDPKMPADLRGDDKTLSAFITDWGAAGGTLSDKGQNLLHLKLTKNGDNYEAETTEIARDFNNPIDAVLLVNKLYVLEYGGTGILWELTFQ